MGAGVIGDVFVSVPLDKEHMGENVVVDLKAEGLGQDGGGGGVRQGIGAGLFVADGRGEVGPVQRGEPAGALAVVGGAGGEISGEEIPGTGGAGILGGHGSEIGGEAFAFKGNFVGGNGAEPVVAVDPAGVFGTGAGFEEIEIFQIDDTDAFRGGQDVAGVQILVEQPGGVHGEKQAGEEAVELGAGQRIVGQRDGPAGEKREKRPGGAVDTAAAEEPFQSGQRRGLSQPVAPGVKMPVRIAIGSEGFQDAGFRGAFDEVHGRIGPLGEEGNAKSGRVQSEGLRDPIQSVGWQGREHGAGWSHEGKIIHIRGIDRGMGVC